MTAGSRIKVTRKVELVSVDELKAFENNARTHSEEQIEELMAAIQEFGFTIPILVDKKNEIAAGHGRLIAARRLGMKKVPVIRASHFTEAQKRAYVLADNKLALKAGWDDEKLKGELKWLEQVEFNIDVTGFTIDDRELLFEEPELPSAKPPVKKAKARGVKPGDTWILGEHKLIIGEDDFEYCGKLIDRWEKHSGESARLMKKR